MTHNLRALRGGRARGFTMLELVIVIGLIGILAVIAAPWFMKISQRSQMRSDAYQIQAVLIAARMSAVKRNSQTTVSIVPGGPGQDVHEFDTVYGAVPNPPPPTPTPLPVSPTFLLPARHFTFAALPAGNLITFNGDGTLQIPPAPTPIVIQGPPGAYAPNQIFIETDGAGRVRVRTPVNWN